jgi:hypothetical protein
MSDNRRMRQFWLPVAIVVLVLGGCSRRNESPHSASAVSPAKVKTPPAKPQGEPANRLFDEFHLPLVIEIVPPEVPPEIQGPSPPIEEEPKPP